MTCNEIIQEITNPDSKKKAVSVNPNSLLQREIAFSIIEKLQSVGFHQTWHLSEILASTEPFVFYAAEPHMLDGLTIKECMDLDLVVYLGNLIEVTEIDSDNVIPFVSLLT